jgi:hypothetical protein
MKELKNRVDEPASGRHLFSLGVSTLHDLDGVLELPSRHFIALVACDTSSASVDEMSDAATWLLSQGAVVIATWGPGCERFHDIIDETLSIEPEEPDDAVILTTWHDSDSLAEAVWFVIETISAASAYESTCSTVVAISVGNSKWQADIEHWPAEPTRLAGLVLGGSEVGDGA